MRKLYVQDLEDIVNGAAFLGSGGGGSLELGHQLAKLIPCPVSLISVEELGAEDWGAVILGISAADASLPDTPSLRISPQVLLNQVMINSLMVQQDPIQVLFTTFALLEKSLKMEEILEQDFSYTLASEIGTANVLVAMLTAANNQIPVVDCDGAGRSLPELSMCTYFWSEIPIYPFALANAMPKEGEEVKAVIHAKTSSIMARLAKHLIGTAEFANQAVMATYAMNGKTLQDPKAKKPIVIKNTISRTQQIGSTLRQAKEQKQDPIEAVLNFLNNNCPPENKNAFLLFQGTIFKVEKRDDPRFQSGTITLKNGDEKVYVDYLNENLLARRNGKPQPIAMGPDLICYLTPDGTPITNADNLKEGDELALIGLKAPEELRQDSIVQEFLRTLKVLQYDGPYVPIEQLQGQ